MEQLSQNISSTCRGDNVDIKYTTTTTTINNIKKIKKSPFIFSSTYLPCSSRKFEFKSSLIDEEIIGSS